MKRQSIELSPLRMDIVVAMPVVVQRQLPYGSDFLNVVDVSVVQVEIWVRPFLDKVVDVPVVFNDSVVANSEGASDSVCRRSQWTFQFATETGTLSAGFVAAMNGFFGLF